MTGALVLIAVGVLLLLTNFGIVEWQVFAELWRFWPLLLVLWGLQLVFGTSRPARAIIAALGLLGLLYAVSFSLYVTSPATRDTLAPLAPLFPERVRTIDAEPVTRVIPAADGSGVSQRMITADIGAADFTVTDDAGLANPLTLHSPEHDPAELNWDREDETLNISIATPSWWFPKFGNRDYRLVLGQVGIPTELVMHVGASKVAVDLDDVPLTSYELDLGAGAGDVAFGEASVPADASLNVGAGSVDLTLPEQVAVELTYTVGAGRLSIDDEVFAGAEDGTYTAAGEGPTMRLNVDVGAGNVSIERK